MEVIAMNNTFEIRQCKKCGRELTSISKKKLCEHCRCTRNENIKKGLLTIGSIISAVLLGPVIKGKFGRDKKQ